MELQLPHQKFVCHFTSRHLCLPKFEKGENYWTNQYQKLFILANNIEHAKSEFGKHFQDEKYWPKGLHEVISFSVTGCFEMPRFVGYDRFSWDVRTSEEIEKVNKELEVIKSKISAYLKNLIN